jgi:hypothetical protein
MTRRIIAVIVAVVASAVVVVGCSGKADPPTSISTQPSSSVSASQQALPYAGAPKVSNPLPDSVLSGDPCGALTAQQVRDALGIDIQGRRDSLPGIGPECIWSNVDSSAKVTVFFVTEPGKGLSDLYENSKPQSVVWRELPPVQGFPAVAYVTSFGGDPKTFCAVSVGLTDKLSIDVSLYLGDAKVGKVDPCTVAPRAADAVVTTLKQKAGA